MASPVSASGLQIGYRGGPALLAQPLDLAIEAGSAWAVVGPNGAGKTTLLRTLMGLHAPRAGSVTRTPGLRIGYVPQRAHVEPIYPATALDVVLMGRLAGRPGWRRAGSKDREVAADWLARVGLAGKERQAFRSLSGGQRQRVLVARALALEPPVLVLDEPTDGMDLAGEDDLLALVERLRTESGAAMILVTHALAQASRCDRLLILRGEDGGVEQGTADELLTEERLSRLYGRRVAVGSLDGERVIAVPRS